jgi:hypothetical protein
MKNILISFMLLTFVQPLLAADNFVDEFICAKITLPGDFDNGLDVVIQVDKIAKERRALVIENGIMGPNEIANFKIPPYQPYIQSTPQPLNPILYATYDVNGLFLTMEVTYNNCGKMIASGPGHVHIDFPDHRPIDAVVECTNANNH